MSEPDETERTSFGQGAMTSPSGTPYPVDVTGDRPARAIWAALLAGPLILMAHFTVVYLVAEAGCTGDGHGLDMLDPPVPVIVTIVATGVAALACLAVATWNYRRWRSTVDASGRPQAGWPFGDVDDHEARGSLAFVGALLAAFSFVSVVLIGVAAPLLPSC
jgi:hypothetical protein